MMEEPKEKVCVVVRVLNGMVHHTALWQVTLDPERVWPDTSLIRFGMWSGDQGGNGDELTGWFDLNSLELVSVLGDVMEDGKTVKARKP